MTDCAAETKGHKKRVNALTQPLLNLKSNTMKNTLQCVRGKTHPHKHCPLQLSHLNII